MQLTELLSQNSELVITVVSILGTYFLKKYKDEAVVKEAKGKAQTLEQFIHDLNTAIEDDKLTKDEIKKLAKNGKKFLDQHQTF